MPIIFKNQIKTYFSIRNILCVEGIWIIMRYFLLKKEPFNGLLRDIGIQKILLY